MSLPHRECTAGRPRRRSASSMMSSCTSVAVWMNSTTAAYRTARSPSYPASRAAISSTAGRIRLPPAGLDVLADVWNQLDLRLHVPGELEVHLLEVGADRLEDLRQGERRFFHSGSAGNFITAGTGCGNSRPSVVRGPRPASRAARPARRPPGPRGPARSACRGTGPVQGRGCRFRSAADRAGPARDGLDAAPRPSGT